MMEIDLPSQSNRAFIRVSQPSTQETTMTTKQTIPATQNDAWGFFGTMNDDAEAAWPIAMTAISDATCQPLESVRTFLDSRYGRHFADDVFSGTFHGATLQDAIQETTARWMGWTISRQTSQQYGIPRGLPYLTGFVIHCEISEEELAA
jgi:hypothetical protein